MNDHARTGTQPADAPGQNSPRGECPRVILKPKRAQPFYARHPWVFAGAIDTIEGNPADGDEVILASTSGGFVARGLYNSQSKITVRLYGWDDAQPLDQAFFRSRIERALRLRHDILKLDHSPRPAYRVVFSEADGLSGLIVDRYADYLTVQFTALVMARRQEMIIEILRDLLKPRGIYLRTEKGIGKLEGIELHDGLIWGEAPTQDVLIEEHGLQFTMNISEGQKTGFYLDQRENRHTVATFAPGRRVLDAFSYSGGFGLYAARAQAASVECVDASEAALTLARRNAELNGLNTIQFTAADVFTYLGQLAQENRTYDLIVLDPPKFARNRSALPEAFRGYRRLHQLAMKLLAPDGILVSCCCTGLITLDDLEDVIAQCAGDAHRDLQFLERRGPASDHPVAASCRQGGYLKCVISRVS